MAATPRLTVLFAGDSEPTELVVRPAGLMAVERKFGGKAFDEHPIESTLFGAWFSLGKPGGDFDEWAATIEDLVDTDPADPSSATPTEPSPPSP